ncbi:MAG: 30S ribosomal protein S4e [Candidatus Altiarchaeota archaeon]|nr:30S ribosomal protein S4e [Candidatus Altiarchaeota archaeon]
MHTKRLAAGYGKKPKWIVTPKGPHGIGESIPLTLIVRDILGYADNAREANRIIRNGLILVDGKTNRDPNYGVGLMDVIEIPKTNECFRVLPARKRFTLKPIKKEEAGIKPCKIIDKKVVKKGRIQLNLHDGSNILVDEDNYKTRDTVILELPDRKIKDLVKFDKGSVGIIVKGRHRAESGSIAAISKGSEIQKSLTEIGEFHTLTDYIFVIGKDKPLIEI